MGLTVRPILILLLSSVVVSAQERSELRLIPPLPVERGSITLQYRPDRSFVPAPGESVVVEVLSCGPSPRVHDVTLRRRSAQFSASWTIPSGAEALVLRVAVGDRVDDRNGEGWAAPILATTGEPHPRSGGWLAQAGAPNGLFGFRARIEAGLTTEPAVEANALTSEELEWSAAVAQRHPDERWIALAAYLAKHPGTVDEAKVQVLVRSAIAAKAWDAADEIIHRQPRKEPLWLIALAEGMMNANLALDRASVLAKESVNASRNWDPAQKPALMSLREYRNQRASEVPLALRTYARSLVKMGYPALAEKVYQEAFELLEGRDADVRNEYLSVLQTLGKEAKIAEIEQMFTR